MFVCVCIFCNNNVYNNKYNNSRPYRAPLPLPPELSNVGALFCIGV